MKRIYTFVLAAFATFSVAAQQEYQVSHNMFNNVGINPGAVGLDDAICGQLIGRQQWMGFEGAPQTYVMSAWSNLSSIAGADLPIGMGLTLFYDKLGIEQNLKFKFAGNYQLSIPTGVVSFGLEFGMLNKGVNGTPNPIDIGDPLINGGSAGNWAESSMAPDLGFGAFYRSESKNLYFGVSASQLLQGSIDWNSAQPQLRRHYYISGGYFTEPMMGGSIVLQPNMLIKSDGSVTTMDLGMLAYWNDQFWGGASYRTGDAFVALAGWQKGMGTNSIKVGIAYDFTTSAIKTYSSGTAELFVRYCHGIEPPSRIRRYVDPTLLQ